MGRFSQSSSRSSDAVTDSVTRLEYGAPSKCFNFVIKQKAVKKTLVSLVEALESHTTLGRELHSLKYFFLSF